MSPEIHTNHSPATEESGAPKSRGTLGDRLKKRFLAGLLVIIPMFVAVWAVGIILGVATNYFGGPVRRGFELFIDPRGPYGYYIPPLVTATALLIALGVVIAIGWLSTFIVVRRIIKGGERLVARIPVIKFFYKTPKEVLQTLAVKKEGTGEKRVVLIQYPTPGCYALAFATAEVRDFAGHEKLVAVFMPTTPNPTTGFLMFLRAELILDTDLSVEEAAKLMISGGILSPETMATAPWRGLHAPRVPRTRPAFDTHDDEHDEDEKDDKPARVAAGKG